jgi:hypothetical protein
LFRLQLLLWRQLLLSLWLPLLQPQLGGVHQMGWALLLLRLQVRWLLGLRPMQQLLLLLLGWWPGVWLQLLLLGMSLVHPRLQLCMDL